jgi:hypothetical protein
MEGYVDLWFAFLQYLARTLATGTLWRWLAARESLGGA